MSVRALRLAFACAAAVATVACGDGEPTGSAGPSSTFELVDDEVEVLALDNVFDPEVITVEAGTTVVFRNAGRNDHNVIPADDAPPVDGGDWTIPAEEFGPTAVESVRFTEPGTYRYYCSIHGTADVGMIGVVTVTTPGG